MAYSTATRTETEAAKKKKEQENSLKKAFSPSIKTSGARDDAEQEADRVSSALRGMRGSADLQTGGENSGEHSARQQRLSPYVAMIGQQLGADFSDVNIHTDEKADELAQSADARAITTGGDIYFAKGEYAPEQDEGRELLAHELTHTIQQGAAAQQGGAVDVQQSAPAGTLMRAGDSKGRQAAVESAAAAFKERFTKLAEPAESIGVKRVRENMTEGEKKKAQEDEAGPEFQAKGKGEQFGEWYLENVVDAGYLLSSSAGMASAAVGSSEEKAKKEGNTSKEGTLGEVGSGLDAFSGIVGAGSGLISAGLSGKEISDDKKNGKGISGEKVASVASGIMYGAGGGLDTASAVMGDETDEEKSKQKKVGIASGVLNTGAAVIDTVVSSIGTHKARIAKAAAETDIRTLEDYRDNPGTLADDIAECQKKQETNQSRIEELHNEIGAEQDEKVKNEKTAEKEKLEQENRELEAKQTELEGYRDDPGALRRAIGKKKGENVSNIKDLKSSGVGIASNLLWAGVGILGLVGSALGGGPSWLKYLSSGLGMAAAGMGIASRFFINRNEKTNQKKSVDTMMNFDENRKKLVKNNDSIDIGGKDWKEEFASAQGGDTQPGEDLIAAVQVKDPEQQDSASADIKAEIGKTKLSKNEIKRIIARAYGFKSGKRAEAFEKMMGKGDQAQGAPAPETA